MIFPDHVRAELRKKRADGFVCLQAVGCQIFGPDALRGQRARAQEKRRAGPVAFNGQAVRQVIALISGNPEAGFCFGKRNAAGCYGALCHGEIGRGLQRACDGEKALAAQQRQRE